MNQWEIYDLFEREKAIEKGHFLLSSGLHSDTYVQCTRVLQHPHLSESLADELASGFDGNEVDVVISPALGGIIIGYMVALALGKRMIFAEREQGKLALRRGQGLRKKERALMVEDVITTGGSVKEIMDLVKALEGRTAGLGALIEREKDMDFGVPKKVLLRVEAAAWDKSDCPLCRKGVKLVVPGSRRLI
ncbi:MAG: orotate phosphoribosyltransferase [Actinomycetota bacterium]|nr:orotate phosphoribosyltransferase [Actinomycetota bacterium]